MPADFNVPDALDGRRTSALDAPPPATAAVVGGGFSGLLTAIQLLSQPNPPKVRLFERLAVVGRGRAYSTDSADHLLNVRAANMSAFPERPNHFVEWLAARSGWSAHGAFVSRGAYGDYLQGLLQEANGAAPPGRLVVESNEVVDLQPSAGGWRLRCIDGGHAHADAVVLATGALPPSRPVGLSEDMLASGRFIGDPWSPGTDLQAAGRRVLLLGTGLTTIDVVLTLAKADRRLWALSRRGLLPREHGPADPAPPDFTGGQTPLQLLRQIRAATETHHWRSVLDGLRPHLQTIWQTWDLGERSQFLRHLQPWWDVHRHRMAPAVARAVARTIQTGNLRVSAGRVEALTLGKDGVTVAWGARGGDREALQYRIVDTVVNCTGPQGDLQNTNQPLIKALLDRGMMRPNDCRLGADVTTQSQVVASDGTPTPNLYAVGPLTRGVFGEITSVPDIRVQAAAVAEVVARQLSSRRARA